MVFERFPKTWRLEPYAAVTKCRRRLSTPLANSKQETGAQLLSHARLIPSRKLFAFGHHAFDKSNNNHQHAAANATSGNLPNDRTN